jgi:hypothetical protein
MVIHDLFQMNTASLVVIVMVARPLPYDPNVIGAACVPDWPGVSVTPEKLSPPLNRTRSPGRNVNPLTLVTVCHGDPGDVPEFESDPVADT